MPNAPRPSGILGRIQDGIRRQANNTVDAADRLTHFQSGGYFGTLSDIKKVQETSSYLSGDVRGGLTNGRDSALYSGDWRGALKYQQRRALLDLLSPPKR
jgi:hypothetical protein